ncbi:MAG: HzsA-related protein, partial [Planctomycetota bacterium]
MPDYPAGEADRQFAVLSFDLTQRKRFASFADETYNPQSLILDSDRDPLDVILRRTQALLNDISAMDGAPNLEPLHAELNNLNTRASRIKPKDKPQRRQLFNEACALRRRIAFANPLLDFDQLLFIKRRFSNYEHMCDQYYGITQQPGGGLFVLDNPFSNNPQPRDLIANSAVQNGRLKGYRLAGADTETPSQHLPMRGSFLSPDVSFDGQTIAFAYVQDQGDNQHVYHTDPSRGHWSQERSYHIFSVDADGANLRMLTDGTWNDFDPCFMPSGRIAFITERRGGYLRCGRTCPTYTLYDMEPDGSDIRCLSFHETNEWHPSVNHDGQIVWTRWDYVDRHGVTAHQPWTITPDGRDPRPVHGNYSIRAKRPDMEVDVRAIPGSHKYVATAAPHHGQSYGSLVIIDPQAQDDDAMGPLKRLTPDAIFPESQGDKRKLSYGNPWPLSENYYLCVYEPAEVASLKPDRTHGLYLVDAFGNKELIYRDPTIAAHSPIPLRARPAPPATPEMVDRVPAEEEAEATVSVLNVYESQTPWPDGTRIEALRIYQILPLSVPSKDTPHNTGIQIPQGHDSINLARAVLGTVPVEADGSAHFTVPARKELYFQALDQDGLAITSMRSSAQFQPGEKMTCIGCHESKHQAPAVSTGGYPLAMQRPPSRIQPDVDGTNPFSYPRLIQPMLDQHCVSCHQDNADTAPPLDSSIVTLQGSRHMDRTTDYYASYVSLAPEFGFYNYGGKNFNDPKWYRTTPGQFGARASRLYTLLKEGHYDVQLSTEEWR